MNKPAWCLAREYPEDGSYNHCICIANTGYDLPKSRSGFCIGKRETVTLINEVCHHNTHLLCIRGPVGSGITMEELVVPIALTLEDIKILKSLFERCEEE
jgi:hypothetical protein